MGTTVKNMGIMYYMDASNMDYWQLNKKIKRCPDDISITGCNGQRFIGSGLEHKSLKIPGVPGNALGAFMNGATIEVFGNAQDAVGDTMNDVRIVIHGNIGDAAGYSMRGGELFIEGDAGYRAGIHMKAYGDKLPLLVIGGKAGSFLGKYQAGGIIIVLGLTDNKSPIVNYFPCTGMHGGKVYLRSDCKNLKLPSQVTATPAIEEDMDEISSYLKTYCSSFDKSYESITDHSFTVIRPDSKIHTDRCM